MGNRSIDFGLHKTTTDLGDTHFPEIQMNCALYLLGKVPLGDRAGDHHGLAGEYELADPYERHHVVDPHAGEQVLLVHLEAAYEQRLAHVVLAYICFQTISKTIPKQLYTTKRGGRPTLPNE